MNPQQFLAVAEYAGSPMLLVEATGRIRAANGLAASALAMTPHELATSHLQGLVKGPVEKLWPFLRQCELSHPLSSSWLTLGENADEFLCEGTLASPGTHDSPPLLILRLQPQNDPQSQWSPFAPEIPTLTRKAAAHEEWEEEKRRLSLCIRKARAEADAAQRTKDNFLAVISHELRAPMNVIMGWLDLFKAGGVATHEYPEILAILHQHAKVQLLVINDLLDVSHLTSDTMSLNLTAVQPAALVKSVVEAARSEAECKRMTLSIAMHIKGGTIAGDVSRLRQAIWNLLINAIKFSPEGSAVHVVVSQVDTNVKITVKDNGQGIEASFLPRLFQRFQQEDSSCTREHGGLGIGLSIVKHVIGLHKGTVTAASDGKGKGSTFCITLPLMAVDIENAAVCVLDQVMAYTASSLPRAEALCHHALRDLQILVVDDDPIARDLIARTIRMQGAFVMTAGSAHEAWTNMEMKKFDMLLSDIGMPVESGYDLIRRVRHAVSEDLRHIPAAALTAFSSLKDKEQALACGFQAHLSKPVDLNNLVQVIADLTKPGRDCDGTMPTTIRQDAL